MDVDLPNDAARRPTLFGRLLGRLRAGRSDRSLFLFAAQGANVVLTFVTYSLISRALGTVEAVGQFGLARSITLAFAYAADSTIRLVLVSALAASPDDTRRLFGTAQSLQWLLTLASLPVLAAVIVLGGWADLASAVAVAGLVAVTQYGSDLAAASLLARKRTDLASLLLVADRLLMAVCVGVAMLVRRTVAAAYGGMLAANLIRAAISLVVARRHALPSVRPGWSTPLALDLLRRGTPVAVSLIAFAVYGRAPIFAIDKLSADATQQGLLTAAVTLLGLLNFIPTTFGLSELPTFGGAGGGDDESDERRRAAQELHRRCFRRVMIASIATAMALMLGSRWVMPILFGPHFADAAPTLRILMLSVPFGFMGHVYRYLLIPMRAQRAELAVTGMGLALQLGLAWAWIPSHQAAGAAFALVTAEVVVYLMKFALAARRIGGIGVWDGCCVPLLWLVGTAGLLFGFPTGMADMKVVAHIAWVTAVAGVLSTIGQQDASKNSANEPRRRGPRGRDGGKSPGGATGRPRRAA